MEYRNIGIYYSHIFDITKDVVVTIDYIAQPKSAGYPMTGGILVGFLPYYRIAPDGTSCGIGLGYSDNASLSAAGIEDAFLGVGFDFSGLFASVSTGSAGLTATECNNISVRGAANKQYPLLVTTPNLSTTDTPFVLFDNGPTTEPRTLRVRLTDFGTHIIADTKYSKENTFTRRLDHYGQNMTIPPYARVYCAFVCDRINNTIAVQNINLNGYNTTLSYVYSAAHYLGLTPNPATLTETQLLSVVNVYPPSLASSLSAYGPLILIRNPESGAPYVADHSSLSQRHCMFYTPSANDSFIFVDYQ